MWIAFTTKRCLKITNKGALVSTLRSDFGQRRHSFPKPQLGSLHAQFPLQLVVFETFQSLLPPPPFPLIRREAYCTNCDVARVDFSRGGWFPSDGSQLKRSVHSLLLNPTLYRDIPYCIFKMLHKELPVGQDLYLRVFSCLCAA